MKLVDIILVLIVIIILIFALKGSMKHFNGEGACCGGNVNNKVKVDDKNISHYPYTITVYTEGMKCDGCKLKVENALNAKNGIYATANYHKNIVKVHMKENLSDEIITKVVEEAGYRVKSGNYSPGK